MSRVFVYFHFPSPQYQTDNCVRESWIVTWSGQPKSATAGARMAAILKILHTR